MRKDDTHNHSVEISVYTISCVIFSYGSEKLYVLVWPSFFKQRLQREGGWVPLYCGLRVVLFELQWGYDSVALGS